MMTIFVFSLILLSGLTGDRDLRVTFDQYGIRVTQTHGYTTYCKAIAWLLHPIIHDLTDSNAATFESMYKIPMTRLFLLYI